MVAQNRPEGDDVNPPGRRTHADQPLLLAVGHRHQAIRLGVQRGARSPPSCTFNVRHRCPDKGHIRPPSGGSRGLRRVYESYVDAMHDIGSQLVDHPGDLRLNGRVQEQGKDRVERSEATIHAYEGLEEKTCQANRPDTLNGYRPSAYLPGRAFTTD